MKNLNKRHLLLLLIVLVAAALVPLLSMVTNVSAAEVSNGSGTWISGKLGYSYSVKTSSDNKTNASGSVSVASNGVLIVKAHRADSYETGGCNSTTVAAADTTTTVTVTNVSAYPLKIATLNTNATVSGVAQGDVIASGATFTITVTASSSASSEVSNSVEIAVEELTSVEITLAPSPYVSYTVNGKTVAQNGSEQTFDADVGSTITLPSVTAPTGYEFKGWRIGNTMTTASSFTADAAYTVFPVIVTEGMDLTAANFKVGSKTYTFWEDAMVAALSGGGTVFVNLEEVTLPTNVLDNLLPAAGGTYVKPVTGGGVEYILPGSVTLVVPYSTSTTVHTTTPAYSYAARVTPSPFRTLIMPSGVKMTVNGAVSVDSAVSAYGQNGTSANGTPTGPHGMIVMRSNTEMTLNSGANLYCWGYINGDGHVYVKSGATVYELFQFRDWRGGTATNSMKSNSQRVFPMNQYYVQNVEAPMTLYKGATEKVWSVVNASSSPFPTNAIEFIGTNGMFTLTGSNSDYITKRYHANVDQLEIAAHGDMSLNNLSFSISNLPLIGTISLASKNFVLPLNNMNVVVETGTTSIASSQTYGVAFLPSSKLTVNEGASFSANAPVYFYDAEDWGPYAADSLKMVDVGYSTANGTTAIRTADNLKDAELNVNGTVNVGNKLYTTEHGANITSSEGTGMINFTTACATGSATTYQATQSGTSISYVDITVNNAWLKNGDETYEQTVSTGTSTWKYDKDGENWYRYKVDFVFNGSTVATGYYCENNDTVTYDASWLTDLGASVTSGAATAAVSDTNVVITDVTEDSVVTLTGVPAEYMPTFVLNEKEYSHYQMYTDQTLSNTTTINGETYYIVDQGEALPVGTAYAAPADAAMGVSAENHNQFLWNLSGVSFTSGDPYRGFVPAGETAGGPAYIYGFYTGAVAHNSWNDTYYPTLHDAFIVLPQDVTATITLLADCGTFEEESGTTAYATYAANNITLDLNGHHAVGRIVNNGTFTLELDGGTLEHHTGATAASATYKKMGAIVNDGTLTVRDSVGGGSITTDMISSEANDNASAVIRNNAGATLTVTGKDSEHKLALSHLQNLNGNNYGVYNLGRITALTYVDISTQHSGTCGINLYNYNTGVIDRVADSHLYALSSTSFYNYGGTVTLIENLTIEGKTGLNNRNILGAASSSANGATISKNGVITTVRNCRFEVGQYAVYNHATIDTIENTTLIAHPDSAQVDTLGDGLSTASQGNTYAYALFNGNDWWYNAAIWKQANTSAAPFNHTEEFKEDEAYLPTIKHVVNCTIQGENTGNSTDYGRAFYNAGVIGEINGGTIQTYKHPSNTKISTSNYALYNEAGGIIKSITGVVNISATGYSAVHNTGAFKTKDVVTHNGSISGNVVKQVTDYGRPSEITSITASGTWSAGSYYALFNAGYIQTINAPNLTLTGNYNVLYNSGSAANTKYVFTRTYSDPATASTEYDRLEEYTKNVEKGGVIDTLSGVTLRATSYYALNNQGRIKKLSNVTASNTNASNDPTVLNGDSRWSSFELHRPTNWNGDEYVPAEHVTIESGVATLYHYTYHAADGISPTIDLIENLTVTSNGQYALRNAGTIGTMRNSTITANNNYALHNSAQGPFKERETVRYYSGASIFSTSKYNPADMVPHYTRDYATIGMIDNCTISTSAHDYAVKNVGHIGTIKGSTFTAGTTTRKSCALFNAESVELEMTDNLPSLRYFVINGGTSFTQYNATGGESRVVTYDYDQPTIDLIGEGNTFLATTNTIENRGLITAINSGEGALTKITGSSAGGKTIYNYGACLETRTTTTPYTAAASANASGTAGTAVNSDTLKPGARIGTIKNVYIDANGYGILNGETSSPPANKLPTIGEIGEGTEIYAHSASANYHAIANACYAEITSITGGIFTTTTATTNAYRNGYNVEGNEEHATLISGGYFKGMANTRDNAIFRPDATDRQTYTPGYTLSSDTESVTLHDGTNATGYYYITPGRYAVTWKNGDTVLKTDENVLGGSVPVYDGETPTKQADETYHYTFSGWDPALDTLIADTVYTAQFTSAAHTWDEGTVTTPATCTAAGVKTLTCTVCGETKTETVPALGHDLVTDAAVAATCTETGLTAGEHCTRCDYAVAQETVPALGHDLVTDAAVAPTCTETGLTAGEHCTRCDYAVAQETVPALGHDLVTDAAVAATCTEPGLTAGEHCTRCDYAVAQETVPALGHDLVTDAAVAATCTETGLTAGEHCTRCDYAVAQEVVPALGHDIVTDAAVAATCTETGLTAGEHCTRCDYAVAQETVPALGHVWDEGEVTTPAGEYTEGEKTYTCTVCGETKTEAIPALGHTHELEFVPAAEPTCVQDGNTAYYICTAGCDKFFSDENGENEIEEDSWILPATGEHVFVDGFCIYCGLGDGTNTAFKIASAKLSISENIVVVYSAAVPENMTDPYMIFTFNGKDYRVANSGKDQNGRYPFSFEGVTPEKMGDNICAKLYATTEYGQTACVSKETYSVREYCLNSINRYKDTAGAEKLITLLTDILVYGEKAQLYTKYRTDALVTKGVDLTRATVFEPVTETKLAHTGNADEDIQWISASLQCGSKMAMVFTFTTTVPEVTTVEVTINGRTSTYNIPQSRVNANGTYSTVFTGIAATEFDDTVTAIFKKDGVQVGQTITYSVNSYVYSMQDVDSVPYLADLVKAIYNYGVSARNYAK